MTQTGTTQTFLKSSALLLAICAALGVLAMMLMPNPGSAVAAVPAADMHRIDAIPSAYVPAPAPVVDELVAVTLAAHVGDTGPYTTAQAIEVHLAADRVCEGMVAQVPLMEIADALAEQQGLTDEEAHDFVIAAHEINCPLF